VKEDDDEVEEDPTPTSGDRLAENWIPQAEPVERLFSFNTPTGVLSMERPFGNNEIDLHLASWVCGS
jgi:hypothetical protein